LRWKFLLVFVFRLERVADTSVEAVLDVQLSLNLASFKLVVTENRFETVNERNNAQLDVVLSVHQNALFRIARERAIDELRGVENIVRL